MQIRAISAAAPPHPRVKSQHDKKAISKEIAKIGETTCAQLATLQNQRASRDKATYKAKYKAQCEVGCQTKRETTSQTGHEVVRSAAC